MKRDDRLYLLIEDVADGSLRVARSGNPVGTYGQNEICMFYSETKVGIARHIDKLEMGGFDVRKLRRELG